jgi:hypothetical protein
MGLEERSLTIRFGVKDKDITPLMKGISKGVFSFVVKSMIRSYMNNESACNLGSLLDKTVDNPGVFTKNLSMGLEDEDVFQFIMEQEPSCRADKVKDIIRIYIKQTSNIGSAPMSVPPTKNNNRGECTKDTKDTKDTFEENITTKSINNLNSSVENNGISPEDIERLSDSLYGDG